MLCAEYTAILICIRIKVKLPIKHFEMIIEFSRFKSLLVVHVLDFVLPMPYTTLRARTLKICISR